MYLHSLPLPPFLLRRGILLSLLDVLRLDLGDVAEILNENKDAVVEMRVCMPVVFAQKCRCLSLNVMTRIQTTYRLLYLPRLFSGIGAYVY